MKLLEAIIIGLGVVVIVGAYYFTLNISYAMWAPKKAKEKWLLIASLPSFNWAQPFFKWVVPFCAALFVILLFIETGRILQAI